MDYQRELSLLSDYIKVRCDIIANDYHKWLNTDSRYQLPSFDYYKDNCITDKGGSYDFTKRRYSTPMQVLKPISFHGITPIKSKGTYIGRYLKYSYWMGTPFNYKEVLKTL